VGTALNNQKHGAPFVDKELLLSLNAVCRVLVASLFDSGKLHCVLLVNVSRHATARRHLLGEEIKRK
jgi:hypothetical protein